MRRIPTYTVLHKLFTYDSDVKGQEINHLYINNCTVLYHTTQKSTSHTFSYFAATPYISATFNSSYINMTWKFDTGIDVQLDITRMRDTGINALVTTRYPVSTADKKCASIFKCME